MQWRALSSDLQDSRALSVPRCYFNALSRPLTRLSVVGYCDVSLRAYAAVAYHCREFGSDFVKRFLVPKQELLQLAKSLTIPQLKLLLVLLLARLDAKVQDTF